MEWSYPAVQHTVPLVSHVRHLFVHKSNPVRCEPMALNTYQIQQCDFDREQQFEERCGKGVYTLCTVGIVLYFRVFAKTCFWNLDSPLQLHGVKREG